LVLNVNATRTGPEPESESRESQDRDPDQSPAGGTRRRGGEVVRSGLMSMYWLGLVVLWLIGSSSRLVVE